MITIFHVNTYVTNNISYLWVHFIRYIGPPFLSEWIHVRIIVPPDLLLDCRSGEIGVEEMLNMQL